MAAERRNHAAIRQVEAGGVAMAMHRTTGARVIIQCKHKQGNGMCGSEAIDDLLRARSVYSGAARLFVLTNAEKFWRSANDRAEQHGVFFDRAQRAAGLAATTPMSGAVHFKEFRRDGDPRSVRAADRGLRSSLRAPGWTIREIPFCGDRAR